MTVLGAPLEESAPPVITGIYTAASNTIEGFTVEGGGTVVEVFLNGDSENPMGTATADSNGNWEITGVTLAEGDIVAAIATGPGKGESEPSEPVTVQGIPSTAPVVTSDLTTLSDSVTVEVAAAGLIRIYVDGIDVGEFEAAGDGSFTIASTDLIVGSDVFGTPIFGGAGYLQDEFYKGAEVTATLTQPDLSESLHSNAKIVAGVEYFTVVLLTPGPKLAGEPFDVIITARDQNGDVFTGFTATATLFSGQVSFSFDSRVTADFVNGQLVHSVTAEHGAEDVRIRVLNTDDPFVTGIGAPFLINNPDVMTLTAIDPDEKYAGEAGFVMTLNGTNFVSTTVARLDGEARQTVFVNSTEMRMTVLTSDLAAVGSLSVTVQNPEPLGTGQEVGGVSLAVLQPPSPTIVALLPDTGARWTTMDVTVSGTGFIQDVTSVDFGPGIVVNSVLVQDSGTLVANVGILDAHLDPRDVSVTNSLAAEPTATHAEAFTVTSNPHFAFVFEPVGNQVAGEPFTVIIRAVQPDGETTYTAFNGTVAIGVSEGAVTPVLSGDFENGEWTGEVAVTRAGLLTLTAVNAGEDANQSGQSNEFLVDAGAPSKYLAGVSDTAPIAGDPVAVTAQLADSWGNPVALAGRVATWSMTGEGGSLADSSGQTDAAGIVTVTLNTSETPGTRHRVSIVDDQGATGLSPIVTTQPGVEVGGIPIRLVVTLLGEEFAETEAGNTGSPSDRTAGQPFSIVRITATDAEFSIATGYTGTKTIVYSGPGGVPSYTTNVSFISGQSTTTLSTVLTLAETVTISVTEGALAGESSEFTVLGGPPATLRFQSPGPGPATANEWTDDITVELLDAYGNLVLAGAGGIALTLGTSGDNGEFSSANVTIPQGEPTTTFTYRDTVAGTPILSVSASGLGGDSQTVAIEAAAAAQLAIALQPSGGTGSQDGTPAGIGTVVVETADAFGNPSTRGLDAVQDVTVALSAGTGNLGGTLTRDIQSGSATFDDLTLDTDGTGFELTFTSLTPVDLGIAASDPFDMTEVEGVVVVEAVLDRNGDNQRRLTYALLNPPPPGTTVNAIHSTDFDQWTSVDALDIVSDGEVDGLHWYHTIFPDVETDIFIVSFESDSPGPVTIPQALAEVSMRIEGLENRRAYNFLSVPVQRFKVSEGVVETVSASSVTPENATWDAGDFAEEGGRATHFLEIVAGAFAGASLDIEGSTGSSIVLAGGSGAAAMLSAGDRFQIRPHWTLDSLFGAANEVGLRGGNVQSLCDEVTFFDPATGVDRVYWFSTYTGFDGWRDVNYAPAGNIVLHPDEGFIVIRTIQETVEFPVVGNVKATPSRVPVVEGRNLLPVPFPARFNLDDSKLRESGLLDGEFQEQADEILFLDLPGAIDASFYRTGTGYVNSNFDPPEEGVVPPPGKAFFLNRKSETSFIWVLSPPAVPQP